MMADGRIVQPLLLLLLLLVVPHSECSRRHNFNPEPGFYCPAPKNGVTVLPSDFHTACKRQSETSRDNLRRAYAALFGHVDELVKEIGVAGNVLKAYTGEVVSRMSPLPALQGNMDELRQQTMVASIEAGRIQNSIALYLSSRSWNDLHFIVDSIEKNPRRHTQHIQNLLAFIGALPSREEQTVCLRQLRDNLIQHKEHESALGGMLANIARRVVFDKDGQPLNKTDEQLLWTTMVSASAGYFRRSFLAGKNVMELYLLDRNQHDTFNVLLPFMFNATQQDLQHLYAAKMFEVPCKVHRPHTRVLLFREIIKLLQAHFKWDKENSIYAPQVAYAYRQCSWAGWFGNGTMANQLKAESMELFKKFNNKHTYETLVKTMEDRMKRNSG